MKAAKALSLQSSNLQQIATVGHRQLAKATSAAILGAIILWAPQAVFGFEYDDRATSVRVISSEGSGCLADVRAQLADSGRSVLLDIDNLVAMAGDGADPLDASAECTIKLDVAVPYGKQFSVKSFEGLGNLFVEQGAQALLAVRYSFPGTRTGLAALQFNGPMEIQSLLRKEFSYLNQHFSACYVRKPLTVQIKLQTRSDASQFAIADAELIQRGIHRAGTIKLPLTVRDCE